ncbi:MAG TPA: GDP-mannose 4,6-dehydratase [Chloroflexota bacterium]|nr:GDP-mannose 4,6-dehydratase [Chloroflexota bacterium]
MADWRGRMVLVTGAGGFIGSHLTEALVRAGASVRAFLHYNSRGDMALLSQVAPDVLSQVDVVFGDLRDSDHVRRVSSGVDCIFHLGALIGIPYSFVGPRDVVQTNVLGTLNVLEAARANDVARVVQTSTSEVYGSAERVPMDETHPLKAQSPYAASKIAADQLALSFHRTYGLPVTVVRPFNTFGPRQSARAVIPTIVSQALTSEIVTLGSTRPTRDLTFVRDTAAGFLAVAAYPEAAGEVFNLGTGEEISVGRLVELVAELLGRRLRVQEEERRKRPNASEVERLVADTRKCRERCGWRAQVPLRDGLQETIAWIRDNLVRYRTSEYAV